MNGDWLHNFGTVNLDENQSVTDPFLLQLGTVTLNSDFYPYRHIADNVPKYSKIISAPPNYLQCQIDLYYGGSLYVSIPVLFPSPPSESHGASYTKETPVGSTFPLIAFGSSEPSQVSFSFTALQEYLPSGYSSLETYLDTIKLMTKPRYSGDLVLAPSVKLTFGSLVYTGVCDSISIDYANVYGNNAMVKADVACQFTLTDGV